MKLMFLGSSPSAIQATVTPAPVMPSERAVGAFALSDAVLVRDRPSGASCVWFLGQAPGMLFTLSEVVRALADEPLADGVEAASCCAVSGTGSVTVTSGMTSETSGFVFSRASSPADTVAESELTSEYCCM